MIGSCQPMRMRNGPLYIMDLGGGERFRIVRSTSPLLAQWTTLARAVHAGARATKALLRKPMPVVRRGRPVDRMIQLIHKMLSGCVNYSPGGTLQ